jgi:hypothetical protein
MGTGVWESTEAFLFDGSKGEMEDFIGEIRTRLLNKIDSLPDADALKYDSSDFVSEIITEYWFTPMEINLTKATVKRVKKQIGEDGVLEAVRVEIPYCGNEYTLYWIPPVDSGVGLPDATPWKNPPLKIDWLLDRNDKAKGCNLVLFHPIERPNNVDDPDDIENGRKAGVNLGAIVSKMEKVLKMFEIKAEVWNSSIESIALEALEKRRNSVLRRESFLNEFKQKMIEEAGRNRLADQHAAEAVLTLQETHVEGKPNEEFFDF